LLVVKKRANPDWPIFFGGPNRPSTAQAAASLILPAGIPLNAGPAGLGAAMCSQPFN